MGPPLSIQAALVARLKALATEAGNSVFDDVPPASPFPRITLGAMQELPIDEECADRTETLVTLDVWSREVGYPQCQRIAGMIRDDLDGGDLSISGHVCERVYVISIDYSRDPDGRTRRARIDLSITTQPAS